MANKQYQVTAALAVVKTSDGIKYLYRDAFIPADADEEHVKHLVEMGLVEELKGPDAKMAAEATKPDGK